MDFFPLLVLCVKNNILQMTTIFLLTDTNTFSNPSVFQWPPYIIDITGERTRSSVKVILIIKTILFFLSVVVVLVLY